MREGYVEWALWAMAEGDWVATGAEWGGIPGTGSRIRVLQVWLELHGLRSKEKLKANVDYENNQHFLVKMLEKKNPKIQIYKPKKGLK